MIPFLAGLESIVLALDELKIPYIVVGSVASSVFGISRATNDVDFLTSLRLGVIPAFTHKLSREFIAFEDDIESAVEAGRSFNLIHRQSVNKFDFFPALTAFHRAQLQRGQRLPLTFLTPEAHIQVATAEDTILSKLLWFRDGGEVSDRQWSDIRGVVLAQTGKLDLDYLNRWGKELDIPGLLAKALKSS